MHRQMIYQQRFGFSEKKQESDVNNFSGTSEDLAGNKKEEIKEDEEKKQSEYEEEEEF